MRISTTAITAILLLVSETYAGSVSPNKHGQLARRVLRQKRCAARQHNNTPSSNNNINIQNNSPSSSSSAPPANTPPPSNNPPPAPPAPAPQSGVINVSPNACGASGATPDTTKYTGPNGSIDFLNCGIEGGGWNPPDINLGNVVFKQLRDVISWPGNPFANCAPYLDAFEGVSGQTGVPAILLASIAMQESSCNPGVTGKNGEIGMMQITPDKCQGDCYNYWNNISIGGNYFKTVYDGSHNVPRALGEYNGWYVGMTEFDANNKCCSCRNNLDYLHNVLNGFMQGIDPSSVGMGKYFNLQSC